MIHIANGFIVQLKAHLETNLNKMDVRIKNSEWESDGELKRELSKYVTKGLQRNETLSYILRDFPQYSWSIRTLDRRIDISISFTITRTFL